MPTNEATPAETSAETPADEATPAETPTVTPADEPAEVGEEELVSLGEEVYRANCVSCHQLSGQGTSVFPALAGGELVIDEDPTAALNIIVHGRGEMPSFGDTLSDEEIAAVASYIRTAWENDASVVSVEQVQQVSEGEEGEPAEEASG